MEEEGGLIMEEAVAEDTVDTVAAVAVAAAVVDEAPQFLGYPKTSVS